MSEEYNSQLISRLYQAQDYDEITEILDEIQTIASPVFIHPLKDAFIKHQGKTYDHYFISALDSIKSPEIIPALLEILFHNLKISKKNIIWCLGPLASRGYFEEKLITIASYSLVKIVAEIVAGDKGSDSYDLNTVVKFLISAKRIDESHKSLLRSVFLLKHPGRKDERKTALQKLLEIDKDSELALMIEHFEDIHNNPASEIVLAEVIASWKGPKSDKLKQLLKEKGGSRAKEIIVTKEEKGRIEEESKRKADEDKKAFQYSNAGLVKSISDLFIKANELFQMMPSGCKVFRDPAQLIDHMELKKDKNELAAACTSLRSLLEGIEPSIYEKCGLDDDKKKLLLPENTSPQDYNKPLNRLLLYLHSINVKVDKDVYGLRQLNTVVTKIGSHPQDQEGVLKSLQEINAVQLWTEEKWGDLHTYILNFYRESLDKLVGAMNIVVQQKYKE